MIVVYAVPGAFAEFENRIAFNVENGRFGRHKTVEDAELRRKG
jgi:hypothetical protein